MTEDQSRRGVKGLILCSVMPFPARSLRLPRGGLESDLAPENTKDASRAEVMFLDMLEDEIGRRMAADLVTQPDNDDGPDAA